MLVSVNAMRAGLLSRFMGILGIIAGPLVVIPILPAARFIQLFWIVALGVLFLGRWPNGRGPAWSVVEAIPWPTAADVRRARRGGRREAIASPRPEAARRREEKPRPAALAQEAQRRR